MAVIYAHFCDEMQLASALCFHSCGYITLGLFYLPVEMQTICLHSIYNCPLPSCVFMKHGGFMDSVSEALEGTVTVLADSLHDPDGRNAAGGSCTLCYTAWGCSRHRAHLQSPCNSLCREARCHHLLKESVIVAQSRCDLYSQSLTTENN